MALLAVRYDDQAIKALEQQARGIRGSLAAVASPALNRVNRWSRTQIKREVARQAKIKAGRAARLLKSKKASRAHLSASVAVENRRVPIAKFVQGRSRKRRVTATFPSGRTQSYPHAFWVALEGGHKGIFVRARTVSPGHSIRRPWRKGPSGRYRTELPIWEILDRLGQVIDLYFLPPIQRQGAARLAQEIASKMEWKLAQAARRAR